MEEFENNNSPLKAETGSRESIPQLLTRAHKELNVLYEVSCAMRTTLELDHILYIILTGVTSHSGLGYNRALLFLVNEKTRSLECKMAIGPESGEHADQIWQYFNVSNPKMDDLIGADKIQQTIDGSSLLRSLKNLKVSLNPEQMTLLTEAFGRGTPWHLTEKELQAYGEDPLLKHFPTRELIIMPLRAKDSVNGLIVADNIYTRKPISEDDLKIFTMLADQAGLAIGNSRLYEMVVHKSRIDPVTGLWNHGFFQDKLTTEMEKARRRSMPLSLAMIDIDNFKQLNDTYGHQHGDLILRELAQVFRDSSRQSDHICRYGGEEFAIIHTQAHKDQARDIAERMRKIIEDKAFSSPDPQQQIHLTVSIGLATSPDDAYEKEDLIAHADKAMYIAKFSGKNKVC